MSKPSFEGVRPLAGRKGFELFRNRGRTDGKTPLGAYHYAKSKIPAFGLRTHTEVVTFHKLRNLVAWLERQPDAA